MVLENFQWGNQLREQHGGRLSKFLIGTTEVAHRVNSFLNFTWDDEKIELTYCRDQNTLSFGDAIIQDNQPHVANTWDRIIH